MAYSETAIHQITEVLTNTLANTYLLALKTKNFHWNVKGSNFHALHLLFDEQSGAMVATADVVAERIRAFNKPVIGTMTEFLKAATLKESTANYPDAPTMIAALVADHEHIIEALLSDI
jgi:starvation-inducible DNA-binding protein